MPNEYSIPEKADEVLEDYMFLDDEWVSECEVHRIAVFAKGCEIRFKHHGHVLDIIVVSNTSEESVTK